MIELTRLNGTRFFLNAEIIETVESVPDTMILLFTGKKYIVCEDADEVVQKVIRYKRQAYNMNETIARFVEMERQKKRSEDV